MEQRFRRTIIRTRLDVMHQHVPEESVVPHRPIDGSKQVDICDTHRLQIQGLDRVAFILLPFVIYDPVASIVQDRLCNTESSNGRTSKEMHLACTIHLTHRLIEYPNDLSISHEWVGPWLQTKL